MDFQDTKLQRCYALLSAAIQNKINLPANEPGVCLEWCGTKTVALQHSTCFCVNDNLVRKLEYGCSQNCTGDVHLKCGGTSGDLVSVYKARNDINAEWGTVQGTGCLTYKHTSNEIGGKLAPDKCTVRHPFFCYSEMAFSPQDCYRHSDINDQRTWYEALEACRSRYPLLLWPTEDINNCSLKFIADEMFWVAVYQWTKPTGSSTIRMTSLAISKTYTISSTSTLIKANTSTPPVTSYTLPTSKTSSKTLATTSTTFKTSSPSSSTSTSFTNPATTTTTSTTSSSSTSTSSIKRAITLPASTPSSPFTSTNSTTMVSGTSINLTLTTSQGPSTSKGDPTSTYITLMTKPASISTTTPKSTLRKSTTIQRTSILTSKVD
ncbi:hypothetical protein CHS0354_015070 [Potamilus streckersoni]|uniref:C-type lectin domain-containing protein n=1 Tax=Potamilus streckersoni TaxID=2493646 RepID=A0AAE0THT3_9BIVA|nr:hypothetical protein CHS0354_015070 [Potamilus streckersoni]